LHRSPSLPSSKREPQDSNLKLYHEMRYESENSKHLKRKRSEGSSARSHQNQRKKTLGEVDHLLFDKAKQTVATQLGVEEGLIGRRTRIALGGRFTYGCKGPQRSADTCDCSRKSCGTSRLLLETGKESRRS